MRAAEWLEDFWRDLQHAAHGVWRRPGLVVVSAVSLGLGIGLNVILYMAVSTIYDHEPTMRDPDRVVGVELGNANQFSHPDYEDLLRSRIFEGALGFRTSSMNLGGGRGTVPMAVMVVTANFFDVLRVGAARGRTFLPDAVPEREPREVVVTSSFWRRYFGDPEFGGQSIVLNGERFVVVGVLPEDYRAVTDWMAPNLYVPLSKLTLDTIDRRSTPSLTIIGRLKPNTSALQAQQAVTALSGALERAHPERLPTEGRPASVFPVATLQFRGTPAQFTFLVKVVWVTASLVFIIACVNVVALLTARATERRREMAVRVALGASRTRIVRAMVAESFLLVLAGALVGLPLGFVLNRIPFPGVLAPLQAAMTLDSRIVPFAATIVAVATLACGVLPALRVSRGNVVTDLRNGGDSTTPRMGLRHGLVAAQVAMSFVLVVASLLCVRSQIRIGAVNLGFDVEHGVVARFGLAPDQYPGQARASLADRLVERIAAVPGVTSVSVADFVPLGGNSLARSFHPAGRTDIRGTRPHTYRVGPGYFRTLAIPVLAGREFDANDDASGAPVAIVNETYARTYFSGKDPIGRRVQTVDDPESTVVGVVRDSRIGTIGETPASVIYYPYAQEPTTLILHVRSATPPHGIVSAVQRSVAEVDDTVPVVVQTLRDATRVEFTMRRTGTALMGLMGGVGLLLSLIGLYGVMACVAAARTTEVGIRMALGASAASIRRQMLRRSLEVVTPGVAIGFVLSVLMMPAFSTFLAGVSPFDPLAFGGGATFLFAVGLLAGYVPARRSAKLDPMWVLRRT